MAISDEHLFDGVYHRMEDADPTARFKNGMWLRIAGTVASLEIPKNKKNKHKDGLVVEYMGETEFRMAWGSVFPTGAWPSSESATCKE